MQTSLVRGPWLIVSTVAVFLSLADSVGADSKIRPVPAGPPDPPIADMRAHIEKALTDNNEIQYLDTQFSDVINDLSLRTRAKFRLDVEALAAEGKGPETLFNATARDLSLASALNQLLKEHELTWLVEKDGIVFTTLAAAAARPETKPYSVAFLADKEGSIDFDEVSEMLMQSIEPNSWRAKGGEVGAIAKIASKKLLMITQTGPSHRSIAALLKQLESPRKLTAAAGEKMEAADFTARIENQLPRRNDVEFLDTELGDIVNHLELLYKLDIFVDRKALADAGKGNCSITKLARWKQLPLASILDRVLRDHGLCWTVADEAIVITTPVAEAQSPTRIAYSVADFADGDTPIDYDEITRMLTQAVDPESWREAGGTYGAISPVSAKQALVITQSYANHRKIQAILAQFSAAKR